MSEYWEKMKIDSSDMTENAKQKRKEAYEKAHSIRQFEIGLFWQRATYYWAFILAAFTAHFALIGMLFDSEKEKTFSIKKLYDLSGLSLFALAVTAFFCYFFSLCWVLMNKGSKFWQKNWENHIDMLQREFSGDLYKVIPNTNNKKQFSCCPFSLKAYDYSVSKITMVTSIALMIASFVMFVFYIIILISKYICKTLPFYNCRWIFGIIILLFFFVLFTWFVCQTTKGNTSNKKDNLICKIIKRLFRKSDDNLISEWINRDELKNNNSKIKSPEKRPNLETARLE